MDQPSMSLSRSFFTKNLQVLFLVVAGSVIYSLGMNLFFIPEKLLSGGVTGFAQLLHYQFGFPVSLMIIIINIPMFLIGLKFVSRTFVLYSLISMGIFSGFIQLFSHLNLTFTSPLTAIVLGGMMTGLGLGLIYRSGSSVGGTDMITKALQKHFSFNMATTGLAINAVIVGISAVTNGIDRAVYTIAAMYIAAKVTSFVIDGIDHRRAIFIVTQKKEEVAKALMKELHRGVTICSTEGGFTHSHNYMLYCVISKTQLQRLKAIVKATDPHAFLTIVTVNGVYGNGQHFFSMEHIDNA